MSFEEFNLKIQQINASQSEGYLEKIVNKYIYLALTTGLGYQTLIKISSELGNLPIPERAYHERMKKLYTPIIDAAVQSCKNSLEKTNHEARNASFDGQWSSVRNAKFCIADLIDIETGKVIDFGAHQIFLNARAFKRTGIN